MCGFDILVSSFNSAGLVNMLYQILLLWFKMCNMGVRPVAIVLTHQFMTLEQVTELFVLYFTGQNSSLIAMQATVQPLLLYVLCVMGELYWNITVCTT